MDIVGIDRYLDGGTVELSTTSGTFCIDHRVGSETEGSIFLGYPLDDNSNIAPNQHEVKISLKSAIDRYRKNNDNVSKIL